MFTTEIKRKKQLLQPTAEEVAKSNNRYQKLHELTLELCGVDQLPTLHWHNNSKWLDLSCSWRLFSVELQCKDIFYTVMTHVRWGIYPAPGEWNMFPAQNSKDNWNLHRDDQKSESMRMLLTLVEEELLAPGQGSYEWLQQDFFEYSLIETLLFDMSPTMNGIESLTKHHYRYMDDKTKYLLHPLDSNRCRWECYHSYEEIICLLIPAAAGWNLSQWADERFIFDALDRNYHVDYTHNANDFSEIFDLFQIEKYKPEPEETWKMACRIENIPYSMAEVLWPQNTREMIQNWYADAYTVASKAMKRKATRPKKDLKHISKMWFDRRYLKDTWLQKIMNSWVSDGSITDIKIRKMVFNVEMSYC